MRKTPVILCAMLLVASSSRGEQTAPKTKPQDQKSPPSLGFNHIKDASPIIDMDSLLEEEDMQKKLPDNPFVKDKRAMHQASLMHDFLEGFQNSKECSGITFTMKEGSKPDFTVQIGVTGHDKHAADPDLDLDSCMARRPKPDGQRVPWHGRHG